MMKFRIFVLVFTLLIALSVKPIMRGAHFVSEKTLGPNHEVTEALDKPLYKWVVAGINETLGRSNPEVARGLVNLIEVKMDPDKSQEYMDRFRQAEEFGRASSARPYEPSRNYRY